MENFRLRRPELWNAQVRSLASFRKILSENFEALESDAKKGVPQDRIYSQIDSMLSGRDHLVDLMDNWGATETELETVETYFSELEEFSFKLKLTELK